MNLDEFRERTKNLSGDTEILLTGGDAVWYEASMTDILPPVAYLPGVISLEEGMPLTEDRWMAERLGLD